MLSYIQSKPQNKIENLIIFIHGYGANGQDLISLEKHFQNALPNLHAISPNAPHQTNFYPNSYYWFELASFDQEYLQQQLNNTIPILEKFIENILKKHNLAKENLTLCGFSQGSLLAITYALSQKEPLKSVLSFSGGALSNIINKTQNQTPICLIHGQDDEILPKEYSLQTYKNLKTINHPVKLKLIENLGHNIDNQGINFAINFIKNLQK